MTDRETAADTDAEPDLGVDPWADRLRALAPFAAAVREPDFELGRWIGSEHRPDGARTMPWYDFTADGSRLLAAAGGWVLTGFTWRDWVTTAEALRFRDDPSAIAAATLDDIARLLTTLIRSNRFVEGALAEAWETGMLGRILDRVAVLNAERR